MGATSARLVAPLQHVDGITVGREAGSELGPHQFWLARRYTLHLACGHADQRIRCAYNGDPSPTKLTPPLPGRIRCTQCPPTQSRGTGPKPKKAPAFDPLAAALVAAMCRACPDREGDLLDWVRVYGRHLSDPALRDRAYAAMALRAVDEYLPQTGNASAHAVRDAIAAWRDEPTPDRREAVREAVRRLYASQRRDGDWCAHRGIIAAGRIASAAPHNIAGLLGCLTWDTITRATYYGQLWLLRTRHDGAREVEAEAWLDGDDDRMRRADDLATETMHQIGEVLRHSWPSIGPQHLGLATDLLRAYQGSTGTPST